MNHISHLHIETETPKILEKEKWVVVLAASSPKIDIDDLIDYHFGSKIHTRINFHDDDDVWMVPLTSLIGTWYVIVKKNYCDSNVVDDRYIDNMTS